MSTVNLRATLELTLTYSDQVDEEEGQSRALDAFHHIVLSFNDYLNQNTLDSWDYDLHLLTAPDEIEVTL